MMNFRTYRLFFLLALSASIVSCKKETILYSFEGQITNSIDNSKISGVEVTLSQKIVKNGGSSENFAKVVSEDTDTEGKYAFSIEREMVTTFLFEFQKDKFFDLNRVESSANITTDGINTIDAVLEPQSWILFEIKNLYANETDQFKFITHNFREGCVGCAENKTVEFLGSLDTVLNYVTTSGIYTKFTYINVTNGTSHTDSIYATPFETQTFPINY